MKAVEPEQLFSNVNTLCPDSSFTNILFDPQQTMRDAKEL